MKKMYVLFLLVLSANSITHAMKDQVKHEDETYIPTFTEFGTEDNAILTIAWHPNSQERYGTTVDEFGKIKLWNFSNQEVSTFEFSHTKAASTITWGSDGKKLASGGDDGMVIILDTESRTLLKKKFSNEIIALAWNHDNTLLAIGTKGYSYIFDATLNKIIKTLYCSSLCTHGLAWEVDNTLFMLSGKNLKSETIGNETTKKSIPIPTIEALKFASNSDSTHIAIITFDSLVLLHDTDKKSFVTLGGKSIYTTIAWNHSQNILACGSYGGEISFWNMDTKVLIKRINTTCENILSLAWNPDGTTLAIIAECKPILLYNYEVDTCAETL